MRLFVGSKNNLKKIIDKKISEGEFNQFIRYIFYLPKIKSRKISNYILKSMDKIQFSLSQKNEKDSKRKKSFLTVEQRSVTLSVHTAGRCVPRSRLSVES